jgi:hypothetical protein
VKCHLRNIFDKLGAVSRIDAVNRATAAGLISRQVSWSAWRPAVRLRPRLEPLSAFGVGGGIPDVPGA